MQSIIKHDRVQVDGGDDVPSALPSTAHGASKPAARCRKSVQLLREQNVVRAIELRCSCGEMTVIELDYGQREGQVNP